MSEMTVLAKETVFDFLRELTELTRKHNLKIGGCGCCDSPSLSRLGDNERHHQYSVNSRFGSLRWLDRECVEEFGRLTYGE